jgi:hypothetical protein
VAQPFKLLAQNINWVPHYLAFFAKVRQDVACNAGFDPRRKSHRAKQHDTYPFGKLRAGFYKARKNGTPLSWSMSANEKWGHRCIYH